MIQTTKARPLEQMSEAELREDITAWMDRAVFATTALGEAKKLLRKFRAGLTPDAFDLMTMDAILDGRKTYTEENDS